MSNQQQQPMEPAQVAAQRSLSAPGTLAFEFYLAVELYRNVRTGGVEYIDELEATLDTIVMMCLPEREIDGNDIPRVEDLVAQITSERKALIQEVIAKFPDDERDSKLDEIQAKIRFEAATRCLRRIKQITENLGVLSEYSAETGSFDATRLIPANRRDLLND